MNRDTFARRRKRLMEDIGDGIAIVPTAPERVRNRDAHFPFRADSDFFYLAGFPEPEACAVFVPGRPQGEFLLFCRERHPEREIWDGRRAGLEGAREHYGADDAFPFEDMDEIVPGLMENRRRVHYAMGRYPGFDQRVLGWLNEVRAKGRQGVHAPSELVDIAHILHEMRLVKGADEIRLMRQAAEISAQAHVRAMRACRPGMMEYEVEAELIHEFRRAGCESPAYPPIVGGGRNGCILHYRENNAKLRDGDLLLIDAAGEVECYAADITRTFPVNGRFSGPQREVYEIVLAAQLAAIEVVKPGAHWNEPHERALRVLTQGLKDLKLLDGDVDGLIEKGDYRRYYMHRTGHWLGMDVHDVGDYKVDDVWRMLEPGMTLTVEPGLYFAASPDLPEAFHNIGIRIEDDVLVTKEGNEVLSAGAPKTVAEIEAAMGDR